MMTGGGERVLLSFDLLCSWLSLDLYFAWSFLCVCRALLISLLRIGDVSAASGQWGGDGRGE